MAGRGGTENSNRTRTVRDNARGRVATRTPMGGQNSVYSRIPGSPVEPMPRPTGNLAYDQAQMNSWRARNAANAESGVRWERGGGFQTSPGPTGGGSYPNINAQPEGRVTASRQMQGQGTGANPRPTLRSVAEPMLQPNSPQASRVGRMLRGAAVPAAIIAGGAALQNAIPAAENFIRNRMNDRYGRIEDHPSVRNATPQVEAKSENAPIEVTVTAPRVQPSRPQARPQAAQGMSSDRLNELSLALVQGRDPQPRNASESLAVERMRQRMSENDMAMGGMAMPRMPKPNMPKAGKVSTPKSPKVATPKAPKASTKLAGAPRMKAQAAVPKFSKGGYAKKGKK